MLKRSRQQSPICTDSSRCYSSIERIVWDGDNILWEVQQADSGDVKNPSGSGLTGQTGNIGYVSAGGLDAPLGMIRNGTAIVLHRNWKGLVTFATDDSGDATTCAPDLGTGCDMVSFPGVTWGATLLHPDAMDTETWYGTVPMGFMDKTGLIYRRNRYYDPSSEQFTQPDPIGMAGGLGIYAYVGGDPVNGGDPYGLIATPVVPDPCDHYPYAFQCGGGGVPWGLQGADVAHETIDMCALDEQAYGRKGGGNLLGGGGGGGRAGSTEQASSSGASRCSADLWQLAANAAMTFTGISAYRGLRALQGYVRATVRLEAASAAGSIFSMDLATQAAWGTTMSFAKNATLAPAGMGVKWVLNHSMGGTANPFDGGFKHYLWAGAKALPVVGLGIDLGESIDSCLFGL